MERDLAEGEGLRKLLIWEFVSSGISPTERNSSLIEVSRGSGKAVSCGDLGEPSNRVVASSAGDGEGPISLSAPGLVAVRMALGTIALDLGAGNRSSIAVSGSSALSMRSICFSIISLEILKRPAQPRDSSKSVFAVANSR